MVFIYFVRQHYYFCAGAWFQEILGKQYSPVKLRLGLEKFLLFSFSTGNGKQQGPETTRKSLPKFDHC